MSWGTTTSEEAPSGSPPANLTIKAERMVTCRYNRPVLLINTMTCIYKFAKMELFVAQMESFITKMETFDKRAC